MRQMLPILLLIGSNVFMTVAWYWHLKAGGSQHAWPLWTLIALSWLIALPEYCLAVPANRLGHIGQGGPYTAAQLKILQEGIALTVFIAFSILVLRETPRWQDGAGMLLILAGLAVALWPRA
jgi:uncharacterized protein